MFTRTLARAAGAAVAVCLLAAPAAQAAPTHGVATVAKATKASKTASQVSAECAYTGIEPNPANIQAVADAIVCLHNKLRAERGLPTLKVNVKLNKAAVGHSDAMVAGGYFEHVDPNGTTFVDRLMKAGYAKRTQGWTLGENLAWGTGSLSTADGLMNAWMNSPAHKANIVKRAYREIGIGITLGNPTDGARGATVTAEFGVVAR